MSERFTAHNSRTEKMMTSAEQQQREESVMQENSTRAQRSLQVATEQHTREQREVKEKTSPPARFNLKLLAAGIIMGILLMLWLRVRRK